LVRGPIATGLRRGERLAVWITERARPIDSGQRVHRQRVLAGV
jgi:hypothetical protein